MSRPVARTVFRSVRTISDFAQALGAFFLAFILLSFCLPAAIAQCSQATLPLAASAAKLSDSAQGSPPAIPNDEASHSSETVGGVRFATGRPITVLENTSLQVNTDVPISSRSAKAGSKFPFTVTRDVIVDGVLVIPCGARVYGTIISAKQAGRLAGASNLKLELTDLNLDDRTYALYTSPFRVVGQSKTKSTEKKIATGAAVGAVAEWAGQLPPTYPKNLFSTADRAKNDAIVAGVGAGVGATIAVSSPPSIALIPAESQLEFTLAAPIAVFPVDQRTAQRLARGMFPGGSILYVRGESQ